MKALIVCSGNTCRSPMLTYMLISRAKEFGVKSEFLSAGLCADGRPMTKYAEKILDKHRIAHPEHISRACDEKALGEADIIFTMTQEHASALAKYISPTKIVPLCAILGYDVPDPYGKGYKAYCETYDILEVAADKILMLCKKLEMHKIEV